MCSDQGIYQTRNGVAPIARASRRKDPRAVLRRLEHLRQQLLPRCRASGGHPVAGSRQAGPTAVQPRGRVRLGQLRPGAALRSARRPSTPTASSSRSSIRRGAHAGRRGWTPASQLGSRSRRRPAASACAGAGPGGGGLFSVHLSQTDMYDVPNRRIVNHRVAGAGYLRTGRPARADGSVDVLRAGRDDGRARVRGQAGSVRVPQAEHLARALARRARRPRPMRRSGRRASRPRAVEGAESSPGRGIGARHASPAAEPGRSRHVSRRPSWTSR